MMGGPYKLSRLSFSTWWAQLEKAAKEREAAESLEQIRGEADVAFQAWLQAKRVTKNKRWGRARKAARHS